MKKRKQTTIKRWRPISGNLDCVLGTELYSQFYEYLPYEGYMTYQKLSEQLKDFLAINIYVQLKNQTVKDLK